MFENTIPLYHSQQFPTGNLHKTRNATQAITIEKAVAIAGKWPTEGAKGQPKIRRCKYKSL